MSESGDGVRWYAAAAADPDGFWRQVAHRIDWIQPPSQVRDVSFDPADAHVRWYPGGVLNASANCLDRHLQARGEKPALLWEGDAPGTSRTFTYRELHAEVCRLANALRSLGVAEGDRVAICLGMIPEVVVAMLACARIGAVHSIASTATTPAALAWRIADLQAKVVVTADEGLRGGKHLPLKSNVDRALADPATAGVAHVIVVRRTDAAVPMRRARDHDYRALLDCFATTCAPAALAAGHPLCVLYAAGAATHPHGIVHAIGGCLAYAAFTQACAFAARADDVCWCTVDPARGAGQAYAVYGPLAVGATTVLFEGSPRYPDHHRCRQIIDARGVSVFCTAPSVVRVLRQAGEARASAPSRNGLRVLALVGEPVDADTVAWYARVVGGGRCPVVNAWEQAETGGILLATLSGAVPAKPGSVGGPLPGIRPALIDDAGRIVEGPGEGRLVFIDAWPGLACTYHGDHPGFIEACFKPSPGHWFSGARARRDADGCWWITGRADGVINVSGHRLGTAGIEAALRAHSRVRDAAVLGFADPRHGMRICAFVVPAEGVRGSDALTAALVEWVRARLGPHAAPDRVCWMDALPRDAAGGIDRRRLVVPDADPHAGA